MPELPQIGHQRVSREGIGLVEQIVHAPRERNGLGFVFRELPVVDGGLDGTIEVIGAYGSRDAVGFCTGSFSDSHSVNEPS